MTGAPADIQTADAIELHFNHRLPPSRKWPKYRPVLDPLSEKTEYPVPELEFEEVLLSPTGSIFEGQDQGRRDEHHELSLAMCSTRMSEMDENLPTRVLTRSKTEKPVLIHANKELFTKLGKKKARGVATGKIAYENDTLYDMSLWKAIAQATWKRLGFAVCLQLVSTILLVCSPLVIKLCIEQILLANALHSAEARGDSTTGLKQPRSLGYGIGLAVGLFAIMYASAVFGTHDYQMSCSLGIKVQSAAIDLISRKSMLVIR